MKNRLKCALCAVLMLTISLSCLLNASAVSVIDNIYTTLHERGYPMEILQRTPEEELYVLLDNPDLTFGGASLVTCSRAMKNVQTFEFSPDTSPSYDDIEENAFTIMVAVSYIIENGEISSAYIYTTYVWDAVPLFRGDDPVSLSWDSRLFHIRSNSFYKADKYDCLITSAIPSMEFKGEINSESSSSANVGADGVSWYADLKSSSFFAGLAVTRLYGSMHVWLDAEDDVHSASGVSTISMNYSHIGSQLDASASFEYDSSYIQGGKTAAFPKSNIL